MRWVRRIFILLLVGAVINIAVAWGFAAWANPKNASRQSGAMASGRGSLMLSASNQFGMTFYESQHYGGATNEVVIFGISPLTLAPNWVDLLTSAPVESREAGREHRLIEASGIPFRSMWCEVRQIDDFDGTTEMSVHGGILASDLSRIKPAPKPEIVVMPIRVRPLGFAANSLFFASLVGAFPMFLWIRYAWRKRRNCCVHCGYDLRAASSRICPECGKENKSITTVATGSAST